ncbi:MULTISPECIES: YaaA family protein [Anaerococcus]|uniref:UPF0246 protein DXA39_07420 n=1 Tax=Anaerococcus nagyae TaxID=1755241 RepID=A0A3E2TGD6_9FIRM|nr:MULTISPECIES: peroxide stress protein YaaA [Anaerococcus]MDU1828801.1 peroxide stress protein YaaA [Anaerococcus sp.]MDU1864787.1 peroxide stress protein YaaA [Anaerococcus sp.]RGB75107.1 YaaA family protein [Anaerococcus nagyae]
MKIILSPAKSFKENKGFKTEDLLFEEKTKILVDKFKKYTMNEMGNLNRTNDKLTEKAYYDYQEFNFDHLNNPAIFAYDGLVFKQFSSKDFKDLDYLNDHVYIISALYGLLKPLTGISDYRLYFDNFDINLYEFWGRDLYDELFKDDELVINLASKEYTKTIRPFLKDKDKFLSLSFKDNKDGKLRSYTAWMKQARGQMLKEIITKKVENVEEIKKLSVNDYKYDPYNSTESEYVYIRSHS